MPDHEHLTAQQRVQLNHVAKHPHTKFHGIFGLEGLDREVTGRDQTHPSGGEAPCVWQTREGGRVL